MEKSDGEAAAQGKQGISSSLPWVTTHLTYLDSFSEKKSGSVSCSVTSNFLRPHVARQAPLTMEFSRQEYWSGLPCSSPGDLPDPGIESRSPTLQTV